VRKAFELYGTGQHTLETLAGEIHRLGLRNKVGDKVSLNGLSTILKNPFYAGVIRLRATNETFAGNHEPIVSSALYRRVQNVLAGKTSERTAKHDFLFRRILSCRGCGYSLIESCRKGHVYYRCHTRACPTTGIREETVDSGFARLLEPLQFDERERRHLAQRVARLREEWKDERTIPAARPSPSAWGICSIASRAWPTSTSTARSKRNSSRNEKQRSCLSARTSPISSRAIRGNPCPIGWQKFLELTGKRLR